MDAKGYHDAEKWLPLDWHTLINTMTPWVETYALKYRQQARQAVAHHELFLLVQEHEDAILAFLQAEQQQDANSLEALEQFIGRYTIPRET